MAYRFVPLVTNEIYHVYNRGVEKRKIFQDSADYQRFLRAFDYYRFADRKISLSLLPRYHQVETNDSPQSIQHGLALIECLAFCLMPNHFHLMLRQSTDGGISKCLKELSNSYTRSFNTRWKRVGPLFQGAFKAVRVETDAQLVHLSRYIHLNPVVARLLTNPEVYPWSSYRGYLNPQLDSVTHKETVLSQFHSIESYRNFVNDHLDYVGTVEIIKDLILD